MARLPSRPVLDLRSACTIGLFAASAALLPPTLGRLRDFANWFVRPAALPFAWEALDRAKASGDAVEVFARGQQIMALVPSWTDGHTAFAFRFALTEDDSVLADEAAIAAERRLQIALAWLDQARGQSDSGHRELELLQMAAFLPEVACNRFAGLAERLRVHGGAAGIAHRYLTEAERIYPSAAVREQRIFHTPKLAGALLANGDRREAIEVLRAAIDRVPEVRDQRLATVWRDRLVRVVRSLSGVQTVDTTDILTDQRLEPLWPFLR